MSSPHAPPLRVLFLATYFPKPGIELMGVWAMRQAQALLRAGVEVAVVSLTPWLPRVLARAGVPFAASSDATRLPLAERARVWAACPRTQRWGELRVDYPRWARYPLPGALGRRDYAHPRPQLELGWRSARAALERRVDDLRPGVVFAHHTAISGYVAFRLHERRGLPYVTCDHDLGEITDCERMPDRWRVFDDVARHAFASVGVASPMTADIARLFPRARPQTVHNGADPIGAGLLDTPRPPELDGRIIVYAASNFYPRKAFPVLVEAFARVAERHPQAVLRLAGDGPDAPAVDAAIARSGVGDRIHRLGLQPHDRVQQELVWADVFTNIGWREPFATVITESLAAGTPVMWASDAGNNDVLEDGVHGCVVAPRDSESAAVELDRLLSDAPARVRMGAAARKLFQSRLTWDANARAMRDLLSQAAGS